MKRSKGHGLSVLSVLSKFLTLSDGKGGSTVKNFERNWEGKRKNMRCKVIRELS